MSELKVITLLRQLFDAMTYINKLSTPPPTQINSTETSSPTTSSSTKISNSNSQTLDSPETWKSK